MGLLTRKRKCAAYARGGVCLEGFPSYDWHIHGSHQLATHLIAEAQEIEADSMDKRIPKKTHPIISPRIVEARSTICKYSAGNNYQPVTAVLLLMLLQLLLI
jgi:hypothetical protein